MKQQLLFLLLVLFCFSCQTEEEAYSTSTVSGLETNAAFIKLADYASPIAGELSIQTDLPEVMVRWNSKEICNLDTTLTRLTVKNGEAKLPIKWSKKKDDGSYGPDYLAYKAGVQLIAGKYSKYVPLVWADRVDSTKIIESIPLTRAGGALPRVTEIAMIPTEVHMTEEEGAAMRIELNDVPSAILDISGIRENMNIDVSSFDSFLLESTTLHFNWNSKGAPAFPFSAPIVVMADEIFLSGTVNFAPKIILSVEPKELTLKHASGSTASSQVITNDVQGWRASSNVNWLSVTPEGMNGDWVTVEALSSPKTAPRSGKVIVTSKSDPMISDTIIVTQKGISRVNVMTIGNTAIGGTQVGNAAPSVLYADGLYPLLTNENNFGTNGKVGYELSFYNYYNGFDDERDYAAAADILRENNINIVCLYGKRGYGPSRAQVREILSWLDESQDRGLIFSFDNDSTMINLLTELKLGSFSIGGGTELFKVVAVPSQSKINDIVNDGPFGPISASAYNAIDDAYGNIGSAACTNAGFIPVMRDARIRFMVGVNPQKRIIFQGDTRFGSLDVLNTNGSMSPTTQGAYPQLMGNLWAYLCKLIIPE